MKVAFLGPVGTYSHQVSSSARPYLTGPLTHSLTHDQAVIQLFPSLVSGSNNGMDQLVPCSSIAGICGGGGSSAGDTTWTPVFVVDVFLTLRRSILDDNDNDNDNNNTNNNGDVLYGVVPIENTIVGPIAQTVEGLRANADHFQVQRELQLPVGSGGLWW